MRGSTEATTWRLSKLRAAKGREGNLPISERHDPTAFYVPEFQRSLVWPEKKRSSLIQSIIRGYPIGALLVVEHGDKTEVELEDGTTTKATTYGIIDGLQRTNAIADHLAAPLKDVTEDVLDDRQVEDLTAAIAAESGTSVVAEDVQAALMTWLHATKVADESAGFEHDAALDAITGTLELPDFDRHQAKRLKPLLIALLKHIKLAVDISDQKIPVLIYSGPDSDLPDIFERINTQGTVLSKYEVFAAAWFKCHVKVADPEIRKAIDGRYDTLIKEGFQVLRGNKGTTYGLFDYFYGLSQVLGKRFPRLYSKKDAANGKSSVAFPLAALVLGKPVDAMARLPELLTKKADNTYDVAALETAILESASFVDQILANFLGLDLRKEGDALAHGELQMASIVAGAATYLFDAKNHLKKKRLSAANRKKLERAIPQHYLHDILRQEWRGPLYTYAYQRVWSDEYKPAGHYARPINKTVFQTALTTSLAEQLLLTSHSRRNITAVDRAVLKFIYSGLITSGEQNAYDFDVEHLIPVDRLKKMTEKIDPWAIGTLGNLAILSQGTNRTKKSQTVAEFVSRATNPPDTATIALIQKLTLVPIAQVAIPQVQGDDAMTPAQYLDFVTARWKAMSTVLLTRLQVS